MNILIAEGDLMQAPWIAQTVKGKFPDAEIQVLNSECELRYWLAHTASNPALFRQYRPDVVLMGIMMPWCHGMPACSRPAGAHISQSAGIRCRALLFQNVWTADIPVIYYTSFMEEDFNLAELLSRGGKTDFVTKNANDTRPLFDAIDRALAAKAAM